MRLIAIKIFNRPAALVLSCLDSVSNCNCLVSNILRITENLEVGNWVETVIQNTILFLSAVVSTAPTRTRQESIIHTSSYKKLNFHCSP